MQHKSSSEGQTLDFGATNEERNVVAFESVGNSSKEKDSIRRWEKDHGITKEVLKQQFDKRRDDAAKSLKVSTSTLKRACNDFGISRWPYHKRTLNQQEDVNKKHKGIQSCPALPPAEATTTLQGNSAMSVKVTYQNDTIRFPISSSSTMEYLEEQFERRFKISLDNFCIKYEDEEDEWISLMCDMDLMYCMEVLRSSGKSVIRMMVTPKSVTPSSIRSLQEENLASPGLAIQAQPPPNAAEYVQNVKEIDGGISQESVEGMVHQRLGSHRQRNVGESSHTPFIEMRADMMAAASPRMNPSLQCGDSPGNFDWDSLLKFAEDAELQDMEEEDDAALGKDYWVEQHSSSDPLPQRDDNRLPSTLCGPRDGGWSYPDYGGGGGGGASDSEINAAPHMKSIVRQICFGKLMLHLRSAWKGFVRIWRKKCLCAKI